MHDGPNERRHNVLGRLRDLYDGDGAESRRAAEPRRELIPEYEVYEPPPSRWQKFRSEFDDVQFAAFIVLLCLTALLVLTGLIYVIARSTGLDVPWLKTIAIILSLGALPCLLVAFPNGGDAGGG